MIFDFGVAAIIVMMSTQGLKDFDRIHPTPPSYSHYSVGAGDCGFFGPIASYRDQIGDVVYIDYIDDACPESYAVPVNQWWDLADKYPVTRVLYHIGIDPPPRHTKFAGNNCEGWEYGSIETLDYPSGRAPRWQWLYYKSTPGTKSTFYWHDDGKIHEGDEWTIDFDAPETEPQ